MRRDEGGVGRKEGGERGELGPFRITSDALSDYRPSVARSTLIASSVRLGDEKLRIDDRGTR